MKTSHIGILLVVPSVLIIFLISIYPVIYAIFLSFFELRQFASPKFIGLNNFTYLVNSTDFWNAFVNGLIWTVGTITLQFLFGIATALVLNESFKGKSIARGLIIFPYMVPTIAAVIMFRMSLLHPSWGLIDQIIGSPIAWLGSSPLAMFSLILVGVWKFYPFVTIAVLARLQTIPEELYDASKVDGAYIKSRFWHITLPSLKDVIMVTLLLRTIFMYTKFDVPYLLTGGGPVSTTETVPLLIYKTSFKMMSRGLGSAMGVTLFIVLLIIAFFYFKSYKARGVWK